MSQPAVFVVGAGGMVGATVAHVLAVKETVRDIVLIDVAEELVGGQAMDISHATGYTDGVRVRTGDYAEIKEDDIIVITCGVAQKPGQSRLELLGVNAAIVRDVVGKVMAQSKPVFILMVTNPVDVLTYVALQASGLPKQRVFGTGTVLDTARLRVAIAGELGVSQRTVEAYVLGEHGDSSFPALSHASISGVPIERFPGFSEGKARTLGQDIRDSAYKIIEAKKSTYHGIGQAVAKIIEAMIRDAASIYPVCSLLEGEYGLDGVMLGVPSLVNRRGVRILDGYPLKGDEIEHLNASAAVVKEAITAVKAREG